MHGPSKARATSLAALLLVIVASAGAQSVDRIRKLYPKTAQCCVYDAAHLLSPSDSAQIDGELTHLKDSTGFNVAVVTLPTIGDLNPNDVALQIGRDWGVGSAGDVVDPQHARGMVILVVPKTAQQRGQIATQLARGAEGIFTDATIGEIRRRGLDDFRAGNYGAGLEKIVAGIEPAIRATAATPNAMSSDQVRRRAGPDIGPIVIVVVFVLFLGIGILVIVRAARRDRRAYRDYKHRRAEDPASVPSSFAWFDTSSSSASSSSSDSSSSDSSSSSFDGGGDYGGGGGSDSF